MAAPFKKVARENSGIAKSVSAPPPAAALQRGESGLALLDSSSVAAFEVDGSERGAKTAATTSTTAPASTSSSAAAARSYEAAVMRKVDRAILPCFMVLTLVNYLDRTNLRCERGKKGFFSSLFSSSCDPFSKNPFSTFFFFSSSKKNPLPFSSYASIQMSSDIGLTPNQYGVGSSLFFVGYVGMQLPLVFAATRVGR